MLADALDRGGGGPGGPDRRAAFAVGGGADGCVPHLPASVPGDGFAAPQGAAQPQAFHHTAEAFFPGHAAGFELGADVGNVTGDADAEDDASIGYLVQRGDLVRQQHGVAQRRQQYGGAEFHPAGTAGDGGQQRDCVVAWPGGDGIADPDAVVTQALRPFRQRQQRRRFRPPFHDAFARRQQVSNARRHMFSPGLRGQDRGALSGHAQIPERTERAAGDALLDWFPFA